VSKRSRRPGHAPGVGLARDDDERTGGREILGQLDVGQPRADRQVHSSGQPGGKHSDQGGGAVIHHAGDRLPRRHPVTGQRPGEPVGGVAQLAERERSADPVHHALVVAGRMIEQ
jgi:hypothetical protein